jgi:peptide/nickel transport system permease protein
MLAGLVLTLLVVTAALVGPWLSPHDPISIDVMKRTQGPTGSNLLGTDELGRDVLTRLLVGGRVSLQVGFMAVGIAILFGVPLGVIGGFYGGKLDSCITRALDALLAFPAILLALAIVAVLGPSLRNAMIAIGIVNIPAFARLTRASVISIKSKEFVESAISIGASNSRLMFRTILPNCLSPLLIQASVTLVDAIITEAALSFLGLGIQPPAPSWGSMLAASRVYLTETPTYAFSVGLTLTALVLGMSLLGDELRELLDPHTRTSEGGPR